VHLTLRFASVVAAVAAVALLSPASSPAAPKGPVGRVVSVEPLPKALWLPETTRKAVTLTYVTKNAKGKRAVSTGIVFVPKGRAPKGGWPVISWAHGTSGLGDECAPSRIGPALPDRDRPYLTNWMKDGYAVVASDYAGLGTRGLPAYLHGQSVAHNVVDIVKAARTYSAKRLPDKRRFAREWVVVGQSQGGGAAIYTARYATEYGGKRLDYRGAVATGTPAYIERVVPAFGPNMPPRALSPGFTAYLSYIFASLRDVHPELGIDGLLTATGRHYLELAETSCVISFENELAGVNIGDFFTAPVAGLPSFGATVSDYLAMPEDGFDKPFFMGHGLVDADVPYGLTAPYAAALQANGEPVTFKAYESDHSGTMLASQVDTHPFVAKLFGG
jgi:Secretory lipase